MYMKEKSKIGTLKVMIVAFAIFAVIATALTILFVNLLPVPNPPANTPPETPPPASPPPTPTISAVGEIDLDLLDTSFVFEYETTNLGNYSVNVSILDTSIAGIDEDRKITPHKIGSTKIIASLNTIPEIKTETILNIVDCVKDISMSVIDENGNVPSMFLTNTPYTLNIYQNMFDNYSPTLDYSSNIVLLSTQTKTNSGYMAQFKVTTAGNFNFTFNGKYISKTYNNVCNSMPTDFSVTFSDVQINNNEFSLYLFDSNYAENNMNIFNTTLFEISKQYSYDNIIIQSYANNIINITNNQIVAICEGTATITFYSTISKLSKTYTINVCKFEDISAVKVNNQIKNLYSEESLTISNDQVIDFIYEIVPSYSLATLDLEYDSNLLNYDNNRFTVKTKFDSTTILLKHNETPVYSLTIYLEKEIHHEIYVASSTHTATYDESNFILTTSYIENNYIMLKCNARYEDNTKTEFQKFNIETSNGDIFIIDGDKSNTGNFSLKITGIGEANLLIYDTGNNIKFTIKIVVN